MVACSSTVTEEGVNVAVAEGDGIEYCRIPKKMNDVLRRGGVFKDAPSCNLLMLKLLVMHSWERCAASVGMRLLKRF